MYRRHRAAPFTADPAVFACISMLARAASTVLFNEMKSLLENMLAVGLSPALTQCLHVMAEVIPRIRRDIQGKSLVHKSCYSQQHGWVFVFAAVIPVWRSPQNVSRHWKISFIG